MSKLPAQITIGEKYGPAMEIRSESAADAYFEKCVEHTMSFGSSRQEAESIERQNLGYYAGYYNEETRARVNELFKTQYPVFGKTTPTVEAALEAGRSAAAARCALR